MQLTPVPWSPSWLRQEGTHQTLLLPGVIPSATLTQGSGVAASLLPLVSQETLGHH